MTETKLKREASFIWACPKCGTEQTEVITIHGPVMSLTCAGCETQFGAEDLPEAIRITWHATIDRVIPKHESD